MAFSTIEFPNLNPANHRITSPTDDRYNCIAWAAGIDDDWWDPAKGRYWPPGLPRDYKLTSLILAFEFVGFVKCSAISQEVGYENIALYADDNEYMHAARQLDSGKWTSKMGPDEDIEHDSPEDLVGPAFGTIVAYMKRMR